MQKDEALARLRAIVCFGDQRDSASAAWALDYIAELEASITAKDAALDRIEALTTGASMPLTSAMWHINAAVKKGRAK